MQNASMLKMLKDNVKNKLLSYKKNWLKIVHVLKQIGNVITAIIGKSMEGNVFLRHQDS